MPTFENMRRGSRSPGIVAIPGKRFGVARPNLSLPPRVSSKPFRSKLGIQNRTLSGVSRDLNGAPLGNCRIMIFRTEDNSFVMETTSDANGVWSVTLLKGGPFFLVEYKTQPPDLAGTSVNTLAPV